MVTNFFVKYLFGLCLLSNTFSALDIPHHVHKTWKQFLFNCSKPDYMQLSPQKYEDSFHIELGYQLAFVSIIWTIGLFFSIIAPLVPILCCGFFFFKYWIDKYNMMYLYKKDYDTEQPFTQHAGWICTLAIFCFQIEMFLLFTYYFGENFIVTASVLLIGEVIGLTAYALKPYLLNSCKKEDFLND